MTPNVCSILLVVHYAQLFPIENRGKFIARYLEFWNNVTVTILAEHVNLFTLY